LATLSIISPKVDINPMGKVPTGPTTPVSLSANAAKATGDEIDFG
jgi:hypothetical protein